MLNERVKALNDQKVRELNDKNKALQSAQQKLESGGSVLNDTARAQLQAEVERQQRDIQRFTEDAQQDLQALQQQLQEEFTRKLNPVLDKVAKEKQVHMVFNATESGLVWADPTMDLTGDIIKALDAAGGSPHRRPPRRRRRAGRRRPRPRRSSAARAVRRQAAASGRGGRPRGAAGTCSPRRRTRFRDHVTAPDATPSPDLTALLPRHAYRYPARLVDAIVEHEPGRRLVAVKNVTVNEEFFQGHFPGLPLMPAVLQIEALTQAAAALVLEQHAGCRRPAWRCAASTAASSAAASCPATSLRLELTLQRHARRGWRSCRPAAYVGDRRRGRGHAAARGRARAARRCIPPPSCTPARASARGIDRSARTASSGRT